MSPSDLSPPISGQRPSAIVVGAGIAGLSAALYLAERDFRVTVYEKEKRAGGNLGATVSDVKKQGVTELGSFFEVYPHMFGDWYNNFWAVMEKVGKGKGNREVWRAMNEFKFLPKPKSRAQLGQPTYMSLRNNGSLESAWSNLVSNIIPLPDMILAGYAILALLSEDFRHPDGLNLATLNDFLNTRFYRSKYVTQFYQMLILYIWSIEPDETSVYAAQRFFQYQFRRPTPTAWVLTSGDAYSNIISPLVDYLETKYQVEFCYETPVVAASLNNDENRVDQLMIIEDYSGNHLAKIIPTGKAKEPANYFVFAVPPETLSALVQTPIPYPSGLRDVGVKPQITLGSNKFGIITNIFFDLFSSMAAADPAADTTEAGADEGVTVGESASPAENRITRGFSAAALQPEPTSHAIVDAIPELATAKTLSAEPIPVLYIAFKQGAYINNLIPLDCYVGLTDSKYALTIVEITKEFKLANQKLFESTSPIGTIIALAASDYGELPVFRTPPSKLDRDSVQPETYPNQSINLEEKSTELLLEEVRNYLPFQEQDIEWCFFRTNSNHRLFLNDVESARNPVKTVYLDPITSQPIITNLAFAGDFCSKDVVMSTVEAAVESGIRAGMQLNDSYFKSKGLPQSNAMDPTSAHLDGLPLKLQSHSTYPLPLITFSKLMLMPYAVLAKSLSDLNILVEETRQPASDPSQFSQEVLPQLLAYWPRQASMCLGAYKDAMDTMTSVAVSTVTTSSDLLVAWFNRR